MAYIFIAFLFDLEQRKLKVLSIYSVSLRIPKINVLYYRNRVAAGGSWLVRSTPQKAFRVRVLAGYAVLCS